MKMKSPLNRKVQIALGPAVLVSLVMGAISHQPAFVSLQVLFQVPERRHEYVSKLAWVWRLGCVPFEVWSWNS
jgi:hypothetical protein